METINELSRQGWYVTTEGLDLITGHYGKKNLKDIIDIALNTDLKDFGKPVLSSELNKDKIQELVLQIQKIKNIAAPKSNEDSQAAPRMLKLILTDGFTYCQGLEIENIPFLSLLKTAPGMKLLIKGAFVTSGYILLQQNTCRLLGGKVPGLYDKWEVSRTVSKHTRGSFDEDGPPPWVNFGKKILSSIDGRSFKSLDSKIKDETRQNSNFDIQRQDAIAEATSGAVKKVFGGGIKQSTQLKDNKRINYNGNKNNREKDRNSGRKTQRDIKEDEKPQKPSDKVSLFDFLEDKLASSNSSNNVKKVWLIKNANSVPSNDAINDISQSKVPKFRGDNAYAYSGNHKQRSSGSAWHNRNVSQNNLQYIRSNNEPESFVQNTTEDSNNVHQSENTPNMVALTNNMGHLSINTQFASRSLKQHLNLESKTDAQQNYSNSSGVKNNNAALNPSNTWNWKVGDLCMAKYWEDNKYYNATVINITNRTCVVQFNGYGNYEEVLRVDCIPIMNGGQRFMNVDKSSSRSSESRRGGSKYYVNNKNFYKPRNDK